MSKYILLSFLLVYIGKCNERSSFEGYIKYAVEVTTYQEDHPLNGYLNIKWGDTMIVYHNRQGFQKREYLNSKPYGFEWSTYNPERNEYYSKWHSMDTIFYYDCGNAYSDLIYIGQDTAKIINNKTYPSIKIIFQNSDNKKAEQVFVYDKGIQIDPKLYEDFKDGFLGQVYNLTESHFIEWSQTEYDLYEVTFTAIEVVREKVSPEVFTLPENLPFREF